MNGKAPDRYFVIRYRYQGRYHEEKIGWASQGWTAKKAAQILAVLHANHTTGTSPVTLKEWRAIENEKRRKKAEDQEKKEELPQTFDEMAELYLSWARQNNKSWNWDKRRYENYLEPALSKKSLSEIETYHVETLKITLQQKNLSSSTISQIIGLIRRIYSHGRHLFGKRFAEVAPQDPTEGVKTPQGQNARIRYLSVEEVDSLLRIAQERRDAVMLEIIRLALYTGLRRAEIAELKVGNIDLENRIIYVLDPKSGRDESVDLPDQILLELQRRIADRDRSAFVYEGENGKAINSISHRFKKIVDQAGLNKGIQDNRERVVFHTLRHTFISWLVINGADIRTVQEMARHRSLDMTLRYAHLAPSAKRDAANQLPMTGTTI
jgi:integrase